MQHRTHGNFHDDGDIQCGTLEKKGVFGQALARTLDGASDASGGPSSLSGFRRDMI